MAAKKPTKEELAKQVRRLQKEVRELRQASSEPPARAEGVAEGIVADLGGMIPGLQKLIRIASEMPEFRQRLASIDEEIRRKFKEEPLRQVFREITSGVGRRPMGIPPGVRRGGRGRPVSTGTGRAWSSGKPLGRGKRGKPGPPRVHISPETPGQLPVDVFDEGDHLMVLAEAPNLKRHQIHAALEGQALLIAVDAPHRKCRQRIELPCPVRGRPKVSLTNAILKVRLNKANEA